MDIIEKLGITPLPWYRTFWNNRDGLCGNDERSDIQHGDSENICDCIYSNDDAKLFFHSPQLLKALIDTIIYTEDELYGDCANERYIVEITTGMPWGKIKELFNETI